MKFLCVLLLLITVTTIQSQVIDRYDIYPESFEINGVETEFFGRSVEALKLNNDTLNFFVTLGLNTRLELTSIPMGSVLIGGINSIGEVKYSKDITSQILKSLPDTTDRLFLFSITVASAGDLNSDGNEDLILGLPHYVSDSTFDHSIGFVYLDDQFNVDSVNVISHLALPLEDNASDASWFGYNVKNIGDIDRNGIEDFAIAAPKFDYDTDNVNPAGAVIILKMEAHNQIIGSSLIVNDLINIDERTWGFGTDILGNIDMNFDGNNDLVISAPHGNENGVVIIYYLDENQNILDHVIIDEQMLPSKLFTEDDHFGSAITSPGDINNDSIPEILITMPWAGDDLSHLGEIHVISLDKYGNLKDFAQVFNDEMSTTDLFGEDHLGEAITLIPDMNNDGFDEILVSIDDVVNQNRGKLRLIYTDYSYLIGTSSNLNSIQNNNLEFDVYPNPTVDFINLKNDQFINSRYKIINQHGINIQSGTIDDSMQMDLQNFPKGLYYLVIKDKYNIESFTKVLKN